MKTNRPTCATNGSTPPRKLRVLDLSSNKFSWRPTFFRKQLSHLERIHLEEFKHLGGFMGNKGGILFPEKHHLNKRERLRKVSFRWVLEGWPTGDFFQRLKTILQHMGVSKNGGTPKSSILIRFSLVNHPFWGTPILGTPHGTVYQKPLEFFGFMEKETNPILFWQGFWTTPTQGPSKRRLFGWRLTFLDSEISINLRKCHWHPGVGCRSKQKLFQWNLNPLFC